MDTLSANLYRKPYGELLKDNTHRVLLLTLIRKKDLAIEQVIEDAQWNRYVVESISLIHVHWLINLNSLNSDSRSKSRSSFYNRHVHQEKIIVEQNRWKIHRCRNVPFDFFLNRNLFCRFVIQTWSSIDFSTYFYHDWSSSYLSWFIFIKSLERFPVDRNFSRWWSTNSISSICFSFLLGLNLDSDWSKYIYLATNNSFPFGIFSPIRDRIVFVLVLFLSLSLCFLACIQNKNTQWLAINDPWREKARTREARDEEKTR